MQALKKNASSTSKMDKQLTFTSNAPTENPYLPPHVTDERLESDQRLRERVCLCVFVGNLCCSYDTREGTHMTIIERR